MLPTEATQLELDLKHSTCSTFKKFQAIPPLDQAEMDAYQEHLRKNESAPPTPATDNACAASPLLYQIMATLSRIESKLDRGAAHK